MERDEVVFKAGQYCQEMLSLDQGLCRYLRSDATLPMRLMDLFSHAILHGYEVAKKELKEEAKQFLSDREDGSDIELGDYCQHKKSGFKGYCTTKITKMGELAQIALTPQELMVRGAMKGQPTHSMLFDRAELEVIQPAVGF